jgi:hypothetical protein
MMTAIIHCPNCAQALSPRVLELVGLFMLTPFLVAAAVMVAIKLASARSEHK